MSATTTVRPPNESTEQRLELSGIGWDTYVTINDALVERSDPRLIYYSGRLIFRTRSRLHEWLIECLGDLVKVVAIECGLDWEPAGETTFRNPERRAGLEGDTTFYFGPHAEQMRGTTEVDLTIDPPPDLAIEVEVEVTHSADEAVAAWGRLGVPEVWRFDAKTWTCQILNRQADGTYEPVTRSRFLPVLEPSDVVATLRQAQEFPTTSRWYAQLPNWVRATLLPRREES